MKARIIATGNYYPDKVITNFDLEKIIETSDEWIVQRTGIKERRISEYNTSYLAYLAALDVLKNAKISKEEIDLIIVATFSPDNLSPAVACEVVKLLKIEKELPAFDLNAGCSGFIYGLKVVQGLIESKMYQKVLLIGAENISKVTDFSDRRTAILFGDGAGAVLVEADEKNGIVDTLISSVVDEKKSLFVGNGIKVKSPFTSNENDNSNRPYLQMNGQEVFKFATKVFVKSLKEMVKKHNLTFKDISYIVPHQANLRIIDLAIKMLDVDREKFIVNLDKVGNTSAASIPLALADLNSQGKLKKGDKILLIAFGSGLTYGVSLIEW